MCGLEGEGIGRVVPEMVDVAARRSHCCCIVGRGDGTILNLILNSLLSFAPRS